MQEQNQESLYKEVLLSHLVEQRRSRRWGIFFKLIFFAYLFLASTTTFMYANDFDNSSPKSDDFHVAVVNFFGPIKVGMPAAAESVISNLDAAFKNNKSKAVLLRINSPGGSVVQSNLTHNHILRLKKRYPEKPVFAVIEDVGASGAYLVAAAADKIYAHEGSLVGSIGVIAGSFGFSELIKKIGVERRVYTSGDNKAMLDSFKPENPEQVAKLKKILKLAHQDFIKVVTNTRKDKIKDTKTAFSGEVFVGRQALSLGLVDGFSDIRQLAEDEFKTKTLVEYSKKRNPLQRLLKDTKISLSSWFVSPGLE